MTSERQANDIVRKHAVVITPESVPGRHTEMKMTIPTAGTKAPRGI